MTLQHWFLGLTAGCAVISCAAAAQAELVDPLALIGTLALYAVVWTAAAASPAAQG
jgi:hypothetical protein